MFGNMSARQLAVVVAMLASALAMNEASASEIAIKLINKSGKALTAATATPNSGGSVQNLLSASLANGDSALASFTSDGDSCVFALTYTFDDGATTNVPDTDLCQTDQITAE